VILGAGQRGLCCVVALWAAGAGTIVITDVAAAGHKLRLARELGADHTIEVDRDDAVERVRALTGGRLADLVVDVSAYATQPVADALQMVRPGGTIVLAGLKGGGEIPGFVSDKIVQRQITLKGVWSVQGAAYKQALRIIESGRFPLERLRTHTFGLDDTETAIRTLAREAPGGEEPVHVVIRPDAAADFERAPGRL
jgi:threonine dehydrogenase-like Zn-dependent dehydrogenase